MARMPGATWRPLGPNPSIEGTMARYDILCYHTMVGSLWGTDAYFHRDGYGGTESHFGTGYDGEILQWQDSRYRADANLDGGDRVLSVETADMGRGFPAWSGENVPAWTAAQVEANARIAVWAHKVHGIPLVIIPNTLQSSRGLGWHRQGIDPWRCAVCERWSSSSGKICPGNRRVAQMPLVLARAKQIVAGITPTPTPTPPPLPPPEEDDMANVLVTYYGSTQGGVYDFHSRTAVRMSRTGAEQAAKGLEVPIVALPNTDQDNILAAFGKPHLFDDVDEPNAEPV
jgi:hypothetical protein